MKKYFVLSMSMLLSLSMAFTSCSKDNATPTTPLSLTVETPMGLENVVLTNGQAVFVNVNTNETYTQTLSANTDGTFSASVASIPEGTYNIEISGDMSFTKNGVAGTTELNQKSENVKITAASSSVKMAVNTFSADGGFLITEIFFASTATTAGKGYNKDQYVIISNNSDVTLYADSIAFVESKFTTTQKYDYTPDIMNDSIAVQAIYMIPGSGKSVPVEPGKSLVLALNAKDHTEANSNSFDLSKADYEFYDVSTSATNQDDDNENVPNLDKWFCYTNSYFLLNNQGNKAYAIAKMRQSKEAYLSANSYSPTYVIASTGKTMTVNNCYKLSNNWILDAVNLSPSSAWQWQVVAPTLDAGYTYCAATGADTSRFGKAVVRKIDANGKWVDTNNSSNDFVPAATPSYLEKH